MTDDIGSATRRLVEALHDPARLFEQAQVLFLMSTGQRWGYEACAAENEPDALSYAAGFAAGYRQRVAEENATYPDPAVFDSGLIKGLAEKQAARDAAAADRTELFAGGSPAEVAEALMWEADRPDPVVPPGRLRVVGTPGGGYAWAED